VLLQVPDSVTSRTFQLPSKETGFAEAATGAPAQESPAPKASAIA
jgi:hypothetical protein